MTALPEPSTTFQFGSPLLLGLLVIVALLAARSLLSRSGSRSGGGGRKQLFPATITHPARGEWRCGLH
jgi:hypothetical protein